MVAIAFALAAPSLGLAGAGIGFGAAAAGIGIGLLAAYVDQMVVFPALFGKPEGPKPQALEGFQLSTTDPGAPRWEVFGARTWVPCHYMWTLGVTEEVTGGQQSKGGGGRPFVQTIRADVGLAVCDGPIASIDALYGGERPLWATNLSPFALEDHRWAISAGTGGSAGRLVIEAMDADVTDFSGLFYVGLLVQLGNVSPGSILGYYRVAVVTPHSGSTLSRIELSPLRGQNPAAGVAGSAVSPASLRRIDHGCMSSTWSTTHISNNDIRLVRPAFEPTIPGPPNSSNEYVKSIWVVGNEYDFDGFSPAGANGRYKLIDLFFGSSGSGVYWMWFRPLDGQNSPITSCGTVSTPSSILRRLLDGFMFQDSQQDITNWVGFNDQSQDPTLAVHEPNPPAHRGIAHCSISGWNLGPHNNMFPNVTARVKARSGETVNSAIARLCETVMPPDSYDVSALRQKALLGYSVPAGITRAQALQPLLVYHRIAVQDRGGVLTFLDQRDLPVVPVATRHLNARPVGEDSEVRGFLPARIDKADLPQRVLVQFIDPTNDGANGSEGDGVRAPGSEARGGRDTLDVNIRPMVVWPYEAKRLAREIRRMVALETHRGPMSLPPGYMDVLPAHCMTFVSNNEEEEHLPAEPLIAFDTALRDILPRSIELEVRFVTSGSARLVDNGAGVLEGFPAGVTAGVNTVDYSAGRIELLCSEALDDTHEPLLRYRYQRQWFVRANKATLRGHDFSIACEVVTASTDDPLPPVPRDLPTGIGAPIVSAVPNYSVEVLDVPSIYPGGRTVDLWFVAAPRPGAAWRGATVFQSPNGQDRWSAIGTIQAQTIIGAVVGDGLAPGGNPSVVDWESELTIDLPLGEQLVGATLEQIAGGQNWALCGDEIVGFLEVEPGTDTTWILRGLVRGMRGTQNAMDLHVGDGERFVLLFGLGWMHGMQHTPMGGWAAANRTYYWRVVPGGASITAVPTITQLVRGRSAIPAAPIFEPDDLQEAPDGSGDLVARWWRRAVDETTVFGATPMPAGEVELYHVLAIDHDQFVALSGSLTEDEAILASTRRRWVVGGGDDSIAARQVTYAAADITADLAIAGGTTVGLLVRQIGAAGHSERSAIQAFAP